MCSAVAESLALPGGSKSVLPCSTGVIGWRLPTKELIDDVVPQAVKALQGESAFNAARDIMTTDRYPKLRSKTLSNGARIVGIAKVCLVVKKRTQFLTLFLVTVQVFFLLPFHLQESLFFITGSWND